MENNFTRLIAGLTQYRKYVIAVTSLVLVLAGSVYLYANILAITPQNVSVSADKAVGGPSASFTELGPIVLQEGDQADFKTGGTFTLTAPTGWAFRPSGVIVTVTFLSGNSANVSVNNSDISYNPTALPTTISIPFLVNGTNRIDKITISGVALQAQTGTVISSSPVTLSVSGTTIAGFTSPTTIANISQTYGSARKLAFGAQPTTTDIYALIPPVTVLVQDWAGNTVTNANNNVTLAIGNNPGAGVLSGTTTVAASSGVATFSNLSIDASGSSYTLVASSGSLTTATSTAFNITSTTPVLDEVIAGCYTIGAPEQVITLRGSNFARNAVGRIGTSNRPTTFVSPTELKMTLLELDMAVAGNKSINVYNPNPSGAASASQIVVVHHTIETASIANSTRSPECTGISRTYTAPADFTGYEWSVSEGATITSATANSNAVTVRYNDVAPASGKVTVTVKATNPCGVAGTRSFDILVNQTPPDNITYDTPIVFCEGGSVTLKAPEAPAGEESYRYQWLFNGVNIPEATASTYTATEAGGYRLRVTAADPNTCSNLSSTVTVSITSPLTQGEITGGTAYCQLATVASADRLTATVEGGIDDDGSSLRTKTYKWEQSASAGGPWADAVGANTSATYAPSTDEAGTMYYRRTVYAGGCENTTAPIAVKVTPTVNNEITTANQVVCSGDAIDPLVGTLSGGDLNDVTYLWEQSPNGSNTWTEAVGENASASYSPATESVTTSKTTYYRRKVVSGSCTSYSNIVSVGITARPIASITQGTNTYFCPPGTATLTATSVSGATYEWFKVGETEPVGELRSIAVPEAGEYYVVVTANNCSSTSANITVQETVVGNNIINSQDQTVCYNGVPSVLEGSNATSTLGTVTYQWQRRTTATGTFSSITDETGVDLVLTAHTTDRWYRRLATVGSCTVISDTIHIAVKPELKVTNIPTTPTPVCTNTLFQFDPIGSVEGATFSWTRAAVEGISNPAVANGGAGINETLVNTTAAPIDVTYIYTTSGNDCVGAPQNLVVRVNPTPVLSSTLTPTAICSGGTFAYTATNTVAGSTKYDWVRAEEDGITTTAAASGSTTSSTSASISHVLTNTTADPIDVTYTYTLTTNGCTGPSQNVVVRVNPRPQLSSTLTPAAVCSGTAFTYTPQSETAGATFTWTRAAVTGISNPAVTTPVEGGINETLINTTASPQTVTYRFTTTANGCSGTVESVQVVVNPSPVLSSPLTAIVCSGSTFTYTPTSATAEASFSWRRAASSGNAAAAGDGVISEVLTNATTAPITVTYEITTSANDCQGEPQNLVVTINPLPALSSALATSVCSGTSLAYTATSTVAGSTRYDWVRETVTGITTTAAASGSTTSTTGVSITHTLMNSTTDPIDVKYTFTLTTNGCAGPPQLVVVTVNPRPVLSSTLTPAAICSGATFNYTPTSATAGATFSWTRIAPSSISSNGASSGVGPVSQSLTSTSTAPVEVIYRYTLTANGCSGTSTQDVKVMVNPSPKLSSTLTPTAVCSGSTFTYNPTSATTGATFSWTRAAVTGISNAAVTNGTGSVSETLVNTTASAIDVTYVYTTTANGCTGTPQNVVVRVNPKPVATFSGVTEGQVVYSDGGNITLTPTVTGGTFTIVSPAGTSGLSTNGTLNPCTALGDATEKNITIRYTVSQTSNGTTCSSFEEKTVKLKRSTYTVIVTGDPFPTCRGQITEYTAHVYRDAKVIYPYLADAYGIALDANGNKLGDQTLPITNPAYPLPNRESMPQILYDNAWRYFQPIVESGTLMSPSLFDYQWTKNLTNFPGSNSPTLKNAGLSSLDYYAVQVTSKTSTCATPAKDNLSNRTYTSATVDYEVALTSDKTTICQGGTITLTADLNDAFSFWQDISLTLYWMLDRNGTISQLGETIYQSGDNIQFTTSGPSGGFLDGDKVFIEFSSALDQYNNANKCARGFITNIIPLTVVGPQTISSGGAYCAGGAGIPISIAGSQQKVFYQLKRDGVAVGNPVAGTGSAISFGNQTVAGAYTVEALAATGTAACLTYGPVNVYVTPLPVVQTLTVEDGGAYCAGGAGVPVTLTNSQSNVRYQLQRTVGGTTTNVGQARIGDGQPIPFGNQTEAGVYSVLATTLPTQGTVASCPQSMGNATVTILPLPLANRTFNNPSYCSLSSDGAEVILQNPESGVAYELFDGNKSLGTFGGTGSTRSISSVPKGTYTVRGVNSSTNCVNPSVGTVTVTDTRAETDVTGDMTYKWVGPDKWELTALPETTVPGTEIPADATYDWYIKDPGDTEFSLYASGKSETITVTGLPQGTEIVARVSLTNGMCQLVQFVPGKAIPLPVELIYFKAEKRGNDVAMEWATASEQDNKGFEVQVSTDARNFRSLGFVESRVGTSSMKQVYTFVDKENGKYGTRYYRLKQVDLDGTFEYFSTKAVQFGAVVANKVKAYPNPFQSEIELSIDAEVEGEVLVTVTNATGQQLVQRTIRVEKGANIEKLTLDPTLPRGIYIISTRMGDFHNHFKLLKQ